MKVTESISGNVNDTSLDYEAVGYANVHEVNRNCANYEGALGVGLTEAQGGRVRIYDAADLVHGRGPENENVVLLGLTEGVWYELQPAGTYHGKTASRIIAGQDGETNAGDRTSGDIAWNYRTTRNPDGTPQGFGRSTVCLPADADVIGIESVAGVVAVLEIV